MGLCERLTPRESSERGNVLLAAAMVLAALVVLVALGLTLAPTGSDGVTDETTDESEFDVLGEGLREVVFVESNDTLDPEYDPAFNPRETDGPAPVDSETIAELLSTQPFTDEQVVQIQSLLTSLGHRSLGGDIAALEPVADSTETGVLLRLGNADPHDFGGTNTTLLENVTAVQDVEVVFERTTLPTAPENATTLHIGNWTVAAYQNRSENRSYYQLGTYDPDGEWTQADENATLHVNVHERRVDGEPVTGMPVLDPGETPFEVRVVDTNRSDTTTGGTYGGLNLVAVGADSGDVAQDALSNETDWQAVVTRPVFNATYLDASTTLDTRIAVDTHYTSFEYERDGTLLIGSTLEIETENASSLRDGPGAGTTIAGSDTLGTDGVGAYQDPVPAGNIWLPDHDASGMNQLPYEVRAELTYLNGSTVTTSNLGARVYRPTGNGTYERCDAEYGDSSKDACVVIKNNATTDDGQGPGSSQPVQAVPQTLEEQLRIEADVFAGSTPGLSENRTVNGTVAVLDPYVETNLTLNRSQAAVNGAPLQIQLELTPRLTTAESETIPLTTEAGDVTAVTTAPLDTLTRVLQTRLNLPTDTQQARLRSALQTMAQFNNSQRDVFLNANTSVRADMIAETNSGSGTVAVERLLQYFTPDEACPACGFEGSGGDEIPMNFTVAALAEGPVTSYDEASPARATPTAIGILYRAHPDIDISTVQHLDRARRLTSGTPGIPEATLLTLSKPDGDDYTLTDTALADNLTTALGWANTTARQETTTLFFQYASWFDAQIGEPLYQADDTTLTILANSFPDRFTDNGPPDGFTDKLPTLVDQLAATTTTTFDDWRPSNVADYGPAARAVYLWLGGVDDPQTRAELNDLLAAANSDGPLVERTPQMLLTAVETDIVDPDALATGRVEPGPVDELLADYTVSVTGTTQKYAFADYQATDDLTVTDPNANIRDLTVTLSVPYSEDIDTLLSLAQEDRTGYERYNPPSNITTVYGDDPLVVGAPVDIETTVTTLGGTAVVNPPYVTYDMLGPDFEAHTCPETATGGGAEQPYCHDYTGPTSPEQFASIDRDGNTHTLTPSHQTGATLSWGESLSNATWEYNETGPFVLEASIPGTNQSDTTAPQSILAATQRGQQDARPTANQDQLFGLSDATMYADGTDPDDNSTLWGDHRHPLKLGATYTLKHMAGEINPLANEPWRAEHTTVNYTTGAAFDEFWVQRGANAGIDGPAKQLDVTLTVETTSGTTETVERTLAVPVDNGADDPYPPAFTASTYTPGPGESITLNASTIAADTPDWTAYEWTIGNETVTSLPPWDPVTETYEAADPTLNWTFDTAGTHTVALRLVDGDSQDTVPGAYGFPLGPATAPIQVGAPPAAPAPVIEYTPVPPRERRPLTFDASATTGTIDSYTWRFSDSDTDPVNGTVINTSAPTVTYTPFVNDTKPLGWTDDFSPHEEEGEAYGVAVDTQYATSGDFAIRNLTEPLGLSFTPPTVNITGEYGIQTPGDGGGPGPCPGGCSSGVTLTGFSVLGSPDSDGTGDNSDLAITTWLNENLAVNETVDPNLTRANYNSVLDPEDIVEGVIKDNIEQTIKEGEGQATYYAWTNAGAILENATTDASLADGTVPWRSNTGCQNIGGCLSTPLGIVDHINTDGVEWESYVTLSNETYGATAVGTGTIEAPGKHEHTFAAEITDTGPVPDTVIVTTTIHAEASSSNDDRISGQSSATSAVNVAVTIDDEGEGGNPG